MLIDHIPPLSSLIPLELRQCALEGRSTAAAATELQRLAMPGVTGQEKEVLSAAVFDKLAEAPILPGHPYIEPDGLPAILKARPAQGKSFSFDASALPDHVLGDRVYGAWLGRCAGCLLGQPVEFWHRECLNGLLRETGNYPACRYLSSDIPEELRQKYGVSDRGWNYGTDTVNWVNNIAGMPEDDDINYTALALKLLELRGAAFSGEDVAERWLTDLPALHTFTAERVAYRNLLNGVFPPLSGRYRNPCREWIGAQIRGDLFGYVNPGRPEAAAAMAYRDASVSHTKNGIYAEMFVAAMLSAAATGVTAEAIIACGLSQIPANCRLACGVLQVLGWKSRGIGWEDAVERIHSQFDEKDPFDSLSVVPNAMVVCLGIVYGELDFTRSMGIALAGSFDKDCNCATVGSVVGMAVGASALPEHWTGPLGDRVKTGIDGFHTARISDLAGRTVAVIKIMGGAPA